MTRIAIYVLKDPRTNAIRYVGKTIKSLSGRLQIHIWYANQGNKTHRCNWIRSLLAMGVKPEIEMIESLDESSDWAAREQFWIKHYRDSGCELTNATAGGEGWHGHKHTDESKKKIGDAHRGKRMTHEQRLKISHAKRGQIIGQEQREKISQSLIGRIFPPEHREKISQERKKAALSMNTKGELNSNAKLKIEDVLMIRASLDTTAALARKLCVTETTVRNIRKRKLWAHI